MTKIFSDFLLRVLISLNRPKTHLFFKEIVFNWYFEKSLAKECWWLIKWANVTILFSKVFYDSFCVPSKYVIYVLFIPNFILVFWSLLATKLQKYYKLLYILQGKMGKTEKNRKENNATKVTKIPKTKRRKYGMNET